MLRKWGGAIVTAALLISGSWAAFAAGAAQTGSAAQQITPQATQQQTQTTHATQTIQLAALGPGTAAGVHQAQMFDNSDFLWWGLGIAALGVGIALAVGDHHNKSSSATSTQ